MLQENEQDTNDRLCREVARRRTFAIISHPDAGKTTLTEKLLLYAGALELAGAVRTRANQRHTVSDWMTMEQQRGISVSATALEMEYQGYRINLLDTPGHQDFCEDTYRTLMAVDSAVMVLDGAKGIEAQTEKLFRVCRMRHVPILTFVNKLDHPGLGGLALLDEIERKLDIVAVPMNWPVGDGDSFLGVYDFQSRQVLRFQRTVHNQRRSAAETTSLADPELRRLLGEREYQKLVEEIDLMAEVGSAFDRERYLAGELTPVFFGSALNNFGVEPFLQAVLDLAPPPRAQENGEGMVHPTDEAFSGFVFKIQANTDPRHRDRMAFLRVCSGHFRKDMTAHHLRLGQSVRMSRAYRLFARERESIEEAFPGDVIGVVSPGLFAIGDMVTTGNLVPPVKIPRFTPEHFGLLSHDDVSRYKQFRKGLEQLEEEGVVQVFHSEDSLRREPILAAVGELQFDVVLARLKDEYGVEARLTRIPHTHARWIGDKDAEPGRLFLPTQGTLRCRDSQGRLVILFASSWELRYSQEKNPDVAFAETG